MYLSLKEQNSRVHTRQCNNSMWQIIESSPLISRHCSFYHHYNRLWLSLFAVISSSLALTRLNAPHTQYFSSTLHSSRYHTVTSALFNFISFACSIHYYVSYVDTWIPYILFVLFRILFIVCSVIYYLMFQTSLENIASYSSLFLVAVSSYLY